MLRNRRLLVAALITPLMYSPTLGALDVSEEIDRIIEWGVDPFRAELLSRALGELQRRSALAESQIDRLNGLKETYDNWLQVNENHLVEIEGKLIDVGVFPSRQALDALVEQQIES
ncbi:MAG: hypothetical protein AAF961_11880, partial [Planctomycetota bacterium]